MKTSSSVRISKKRGTGRLQLQVIGTKSSESRSLSRVPKSRDSLSSTSIHGKIIRLRKRSFRNKSNAYGRRILRNTRRDT